MCGGETDCQCVCLPVCFFLHRLLCWCACMLNCGCCVPQDQRLVCIQLCFSTVCYCTVAYLSHSLGYNDSYLWSHSSLWCPVLLPIIEISNTLFFSAVPIFSLSPLSLSFSLPITIILSFYMHPLTNVVWVVLVILLLSPPHCWMLYWVLSWFYMTLGPSPSETHVPTHHAYH